VRREAAGRQDKGPLVRANRRVYDATRFVCRKPHFTPSIAKVIEACVNRVQAGPALLCKAKGF